MRVCARHFEAIYVVSSGRQGRRSPRLADAGPEFFKQTQKGTNSKKTPDMESHRCVRAKAKVDCPCGSIKFHVVLLHVGSWDSLWLGL